MNYVDCTFLCNLFFWILVLYRLKVFFVLLVMLSHLVLSRQFLHQTLQTRAYSQSEKFAFLQTCMLSSFWNQWKAIYFMVVKTGELTAKDGILGWWVKTAGNSNCWSKFFLSLNLINIMSVHEQLCRQEQLVWTTWPIPQV